MRLLHLVHTPRHSGAEMLVRDLCLRHMQNGVACAIAAFDQGTPQFAPELDLLRAAGVEIFALKRTGGRLGRLRNYVRAIRIFRPDTIFGHSLIPAAYGRVAALLVGSRARFIKVLHSSSDDYQSPRVRVMERLLQARTDGIVTVAPTAANHYRRHFHSTPPIVHIANGINLEQIREATEHRAAIRADFGLAPTDRLLLQVGRIAPVKNQRLALATVIPLMQTDRSVHLWFAGVVEDASYHERLITEIEASGLVDRVRYLGARSDIPGLLAAADVYLMPSVSEAHSVALLEALASGVTIVASDIEAFGFAREMAGVTLIDASNAQKFRSSVAVQASSNCRHQRNLECYDLRVAVRAYEALSGAPPSLS